MFKHSDCAVKVDDEVSRSGLEAVGDWTKRKARSIFSKKTLYKRLPILRWLPK